MPGNEIRRKEIRSKDRNIENSRKGNVMKEKSKGIKESKKTPQKTLKEKRKEKKEKKKW